MTKIMNSYVKSLSAVHVSQHQLQHASCKFCNRSCNRLTYENMCICMFKRTSVAGNYTFAELNDCLYPCWIFCTFNTGSIGHTYNVQVTFKLQECVLTSTSQHPMMQQQLQLCQISKTGYRSLLHNFKFSHREKNHRM